LSLRVLPQKDVAISALIPTTEILRRFAPQDDKRGAKIATSFFHSGMAPRDDRLFFDKLRMTLRQAQGERIFGWDIRFRSW